jgi:outer membrane protein assembly factor BamA
VTPRAYNPLLTLQPRAYSVKITPGNFGEATIVTATGSDIAGLHSITASITTEWNHPDLQTNIQYVYSRLPFDVNASVFRQITPATNYSLGSNTVQWIQQTVGATTGISYDMPRAFDSQSVNVSYSIANVSGQLPLPTSELDPYDLPSVPTQGMLGTVHLGWGYSNAEGYLWSIGNEKGFDASVTFDVADPALASNFTGYAVTGNLATYLPMPWLRHNVLALHVGGGMGGGDRAGQGPYYVGGFIDLPVVNVVQNSLIQGGIQLRGYPVVAEAGNYYTLANAEYRFPIVNVDRGPSTLPIFLNRISGAAFVDCGAAFDDPKSAQFKTGVGGELWFDLTLGYILGFTFRAGYAKGVSTGGIDKTYFVAAVPF